MKLLVCFVQERTGKAPSALDWADLDERKVSALLEHLETDRHNSARTRNLRLTGVRSLLSYAAARHPEHAALIQRVLAIPPKRFEKREVDFLSEEEAKALLQAPDQGRWEGRRDRALFVLGLQTGLRVSEIVGLDCTDVVLGTEAHVRCEGKGRKQRAVPLTRAAQQVLRAWLMERARTPGVALFPTRTGRRLSRDAVASRLATYAALAAQRCPSLGTKRLHPHILRHSPVIYPASDPMRDVSSAAWNCRTSQVFASAQGT
jgi:site-specific recombinase XerD